MTGIDWEQLAAEGARSRVELEADPQARRVLAMYRVWLNRWMREDEDMPQYKGWNEWYQYNETRLTMRIELGWYDLLIITAGTGDDGGPATLYAWVPAKNHPYYTRYAKDHPIYQKPHAIVQEFDTSVQFIYNQEEGGYVHTPDDR